ncbi:MAG: hypothetical protein ABIP35_17290 [Ginsengibacter sp.]
MTFLKCHFCAGVRFFCLTLKKSISGEFQNIAGWWGHQPGQPAVGGVSTAHYQRSDATF